MQKRTIAQRMNDFTQKISDKISEKLFPAPQEEAKPFAEWYAEMKTLDDVAQQLAEVYQHQANEIKRYYNYNKR
jgi:hypothetical protein